jgi:D-beta-D-heptose 7-phosphate kinase/D-beta-D-heptose 1-phosphate adenosyltransferase
VGHKRVKKVFVNGCFDLLHEGHIRFLQAAKTNCEFLLVGINSDESVRRTKGSARPILNQDERKSALLSLGWVDEVHIFEENDPTNLIESLCPDRVIKDIYYLNHDMPEIQIIKRLNIDLAFIDCYVDISTTKIIDIILRRYTGRSAASEEENNI